MRIDDLLLGEWPEPVRTATALFRQGDLVADPPFVLVEDRTHPTTRAVKENVAAGTGPVVLPLPSGHRPEYGIITSQTCDIDEVGNVRNPVIQYAPVVNLVGTLSPGQDGQIQNGAHADLVYLTQQPTDDSFWVADLRYCFSIGKGFLVGKEPHSGFTEEWQRLRFADRLAARVARAAFSGPVQEHVITGLNTWIDRQWGYTVKKGLARYTGVEQVCLKVCGDRLAPDWVQLVVFEQMALAAEDKAAWGQWRDEANGRLTADPDNQGEHATTLHPIQFAAMAEMRASEYSLLTSVALPALRRC